MKYNCKINCCTSNLKIIRDFTFDVLNILGTDEHERKMIILAIDEVCSNAIIHSNKNNPEDYLEINIEDDGSGIYIDILNKGEPYDFSNYFEPDVEQLVHQRKKGGVGLFLAKRIMDKIEFSNEETLNKWRLFKKLERNNEQIKTK